MWEVGGVGIGVGRDPEGGEAGGPIGSGRGWGRIVGKWVRVRAGCGGCGRVGVVG